MLTRLRVKNFKSFQDADLQLGQLTVLIGTNASGKSNLRDAFRFLHGVGRGYTLPEILGEKWGDAGILEWTGIRGGIDEFSYKSQSDEHVVMELVEDTISTTVTINLSSMEHVITFDDPQIDLIQVKEKNIENLQTKLPDLLDAMINKLRNIDNSSSQKASITYDSLIQFEKIFLGTEREPYIEFLKKLRSEPRLLLSSLQMFRFFDLSPIEMRRPNLPGQKFLTDNGENLSSVLHSICKEDSQKQNLLSWLTELLSQDVVDLRFTEDHKGRVILNLVEVDGRVISADSASDGTLRFLGMLAAFFSPEPGKLYFFEEIENGIHPSRLYLLMQLLEQQAKKGKTQIIVSSHSPTLLDYLSPESLEHASLVYRIPGEGSKIIRLKDIPHFEEITSGGSFPSGLHTEGWFETVMTAVEGEKDEL